MISIINTFLNYRIQKVQSFERTQRERSEEEERKVHLWRMEQKSSFPNTELERSNGLKILCLDGGGCGISSLYNLQAIMTQVAPGARPCDHFDLICGTSTGGLIAIMLGRLRMSIEHCIEEYKIIARDVFGDSTLEKSFRLTRRKCLYSGNKLTKAIKRLVEKYGGDADARLKSKDESCRTFVLATRYHNTTTKIFRAYDNLNSSSGAPADNCTIWEAGRATCCTPFLCPEISIPDRTGMSYCNGSPHINNPAVHALNEAKSIWGEDCGIQTLVSIGTGLPESESLRSSGTRPMPWLLQAFVDVATESENTHQSMEDMCEQLDCYWRLNVPMKRIALNHFEDMQDLAWDTIEYIRCNQDQIRRCAESIVGTPQEVPEFSQKTTL